MPTIEPASEWMNEYFDTNVTSKAGNGEQMLFTESQSRWGRTDRRTGEHRETSSVKQAFYSSVRARVQSWQPWESVVCHNPKTICNSMTKDKWNKNKANQTKTTQHKKETITIINIIQTLSDSGDNVGCRWLDVALNYLENFSCLGEFFLD